MPRWKRAWIVEQARKRGTTYRVCHLDQNGKRTYPASFWSRRLAEEYRTKTELYINGKGPLPTITEAPVRFQVEPDRRQWGQTVDAWLAVHSPRKEKTGRLLTGNLRAFALASGVETVEEVTTDQIAAHLVMLKATDKAHATIGQRLAVLRQFLNWARPADNPCTRELLAQWKPYRQHKKTNPHYYTDDEYQNILSACNTIGHRGRSPLWWQTYLTLLHDCGMRLNEAAHLTWGHIDLEVGIVRIEPHKAPGLVNWEPKGTSTRTLPLTRRTIIYLTNLYERFCSVGIPYVFLRERRYHDVMQNGVGVRGDLLNGVLSGFRRIRKVAGIPAGTIHDLRRTCITNWAKRTDLTPKDVQYLAGHADIKTTFDVYAMVNREDVIEKARRTPQCPGSPPVHMERSPQTP